MNISQGNNKIQNWLAYAPLIYNQLLFIQATNLRAINQIKWLRGVTNIKSSFKFQQGFICITGPTGRKTMEGYNQGGFSLYKCAIPVDEQRDDDRIKPIIKLRSHWIFQQQIDLLQQYGNNLQDLQLNNMFAFSNKNKSAIKLISTRKLLEQGIHTNSYIDKGCLKLQGHTQPITCIKWANLQNSNYKIFTSSQDNTIIQWDIQKISLQRHMKFHRNIVTSITPIFNYSTVWSDGPAVNNIKSTLASASTDGYIFIWDNKSQIPVSKINPKQKQVYSIDAVSQYCLISGGLSGTIKLWDLRNTRDYLYQQAIDKTLGHQRAIRQIKVARQDNKPNQKLQQICKNYVGKIKFTTSDDSGKIVQWREKIQFVHQGHQSSCTFDLADNSKLCVSAERRKNIFMIWQPGVTIGPNQL